MTDLPPLLLANLALSAGILVVFLLRKPVRMAFGPAQAYALWLLPLLAAAACFLPPRVIEVFLKPEDFVDSMDSFVTYTVQQPATGPALQSTPPLDPLAILTLIWIAGLVAMIAWLALSQSRFMASVKRGMAGPAVVGLFRPRIVTPSDFDTRFDPRERDVILAHETVHLRRNDARINALAALLRCVCWFNPLVHLAAHFLRIDQEMACDAAVVARRPKLRRLYADALVKTQLAARPLPLGCYWPPGAEHPLTERIAMLKRQAPGRARRLAGAGLLLALVFGAGLAAWAAIPARQNFIVPPNAESALPGDIARAAKQVPPPPAKLELPEAPKPAPAPAKPTLEPFEIPKPAPFPARDELERIFPETTRLLPPEYDADAPVTLVGKVESVTTAPYGASLTLTLKANAIAEGFPKDNTAYTPNTQTWRMSWGSAYWEKGFAERMKGQEIAVRGYRAKDRTCNPDCLLYARDINFHNADFFVPVPRPPLDRALALIAGRRVPDAFEVIPGSEGHPWQTVFNVSAETVMVDSERKHAIYEGDVVVRFNGYQFRAGKITVNQLKPAMPATSSFEARAKVVTQDTATGIITYDGKVELRFGDIILKADRITSQRVFAATPATVLSDEYQRGVRYFAMPTIESGGVQQSPPDVFASEARRAILDDLSRAMQKAIPNGRSVAPPPEEPQAAPTLRQILPAPPIEQPALAAPPLPPVAPAPAQQLRLVALKRVLIEVRSASGDNYVHRYFEPGESYTPRVGSGWTVSVSDGTAVEWRLGEKSLGLVGAQAAPISAQSVDLAATRPDAGFEH